MTIEVKLVERGRYKFGYVNLNDHKVIRKKTRCNSSSSSSRRLIRSKQVVPAVPISTLQRLYAACRDVFKGPGTVPPPCDVQKLRHILDGMLPEDVGLSRELQFFKPSSSSSSSGAVKGVPRVTSTTIYKCDNFSLCIFFLPATAVIPLHNHPGMTVFSKLLLGTMHIKAYDWVDPSTPPSDLRLARLKADSVFTAPCDTCVLYPTSGGNIHAFTAIKPCAVLDVLGPPYCKADGRDCSYYKLDMTPYSALISNGGGSMIAKEEEEAHIYGWLGEIEMPKESEMDAIEYLGPQINETSD